MATNKERAEAHPSRKGMVRGYAQPPKGLLEEGKKIVQGKDPKKEISKTPKSRSAAALQLRIDGAGWYEIAQILDFEDAAIARKTVEHALASEPKAEEDVERIRDLESRRIERILASLMPRARNPKDPDHLRYANTALAAIKQHTDLHGAAAPQRVDITYNPSAKQLEEWVSGISEALHGKTAEADIIDAEIVEG